MLELRYSKFITVVVVGVLYTCLSYSSPVGAEVAMKTVIVDRGMSYLDESAVTSAGENLMTLEVASTDASETTTVEDSSVATNMTTMKDASLTTESLTRDIGNMTTMEDVPFTTESSTHDVEYLTTMEDASSTTESSTHDIEDMTTMEDFSLTTESITQDVEDLTTMEDASLTTESLTHDIEDMTTMEDSSLETESSTQHVRNMTLEDVAEITESLSTTNKDSMTFDVADESTTYDAILTSKILTQVAKITTGILETSEIDADETTSIDEGFGGLYSSRHHQQTKRSTAGDTYTVSYMDDDDGDSRAPRRSALRDNTQEELKVLYNKHMKSVEAFKCREPQERALNIRDLLGDVDSSHLAFHPNMVSLHRCGLWSGCCMAPIEHDMQCAMKTEQVVNLTFSVLEVITNKYTQWTQQVKNHTSCSCQGMAKKRPLKLPVGELTPEL